jgi:hypothetical protein
LTERQLLTKTDTRFELVKEFGSSRNEKTKKKPARIKTMKTIKAQKTIIGLSAAVLLSAAASAQVSGDPIYRIPGQNLTLDNSGNPIVLGTTDVPAGTTEYGDQVAFGGTGRSLTDLKYSYFLSGNASGNEKAQLFLRALDGPTITVGTDTVATPGSTLYTGPILDLATGYGTVEINGIDGRTLPNSVAWSVVFSGVDSGETLGLLYANPPDVGSSQDDFWAKVGGTWTLLDTPNLTDNFAFAAYAVPEPTTWALILGGLGVFGLIRRRKA